MEKADIPVAEGDKARPITVSRGSFFNRLSEKKGAFICEGPLFQKAFSIESFFKENPSLFSMYLDHTSLDYLV